MKNLLMAVTIGLSLITIGTTTVHAELEETATDIVYNSGIEQTATDVVYNSGLEESATDIVAKGEEMVPEILNFLENPLGDFSEKFNAISEQITQSFKQIKIANPFKSKDIKTNDYMMVSNVKPENKDTDTNLFTAKNFNLAFKAFAFRQKTLRTLETTAEQDNVLILQIIILILGLITLIITVLGYKFKHA